MPFLCSFNFAGASGHAPPPWLSTTPLMPLSAHSSHRGCSLTSWLWWPGELVFLGPMGLKQRDSSQQAAVLGHVMAERNTPDLPVKKAYLLVLELHSEGQLQVYHPLGSRKVLSGTQTGDASFVVFLGLTTAHQSLPVKSICTHLDP